MRRAFALLLAASVLSIGSLSLTGCIVAPARGYHSRVWVPGYWAPRHVWVGGHWRYR